MKVLKTFLSKKLFVFVATALLNFFNAKFQLGIDDATIANITKAAAAYLLGQSAVDVAAVVSKNAPNPPSVGQADYPQGNGSIVNAPAPLN